MGQAVPGGAPVVRGQPRKMGVFPPIFALGEHGSGGVYDPHHHEGK
jgi:hypothetical protein